MSVGPGRRLRSGLRDISDGLEPVDGRIWVMYDDEEILAFTEEGIENLK